MLRAKLEEQREDSGEQTRRRRGPPPSKIREDMERLEMSHMTGRFSGGERAFIKKMKELSEALKEATEAQRGGGMREKGGRVTRRESMAPGPNWVFRIKRGSGPEGA